MPADAIDVADQVEPFRRLRATGDPALREQLIEANLGLAHHLAQRFHGRGVERDDLHQVALIGLVKAVDRFDPERGVAFATFARPYVEGEIRHHFRDAAWDVAVPRGVKDLAARLPSTRAELTARLGAEPTPADLADALGVTVDDILSALDAAASFSAETLDASDDGPTHTAATIDSAYASIESSLVLAQASGILDDRERRILYLRFVEERTQQEIADDVGVSQVHVSRLIRRSLAELRGRLEGQG